MKRTTPLLLAALLAASTASAQPEPDAPAPAPPTHSGAVGLAQALNGETGTTTASYGRISRTVFTLVLDRHHEGAVIDDFGVIQLCIRDGCGHNQFAF